MDRTVVVYLINEEYEVDAYGVAQTTETETKVYAQVSSVSATEWFEGGRNGLNPELRVTMRQCDYDGQKIVEYNDARYTVYRTYIGRKDNVELYLERREGHA